MIKKKFDKPHCGACGNVVPLEKRFITHAYCREIRALKLEKREWTFHTGYFCPSCSAVTEVWYFTNEDPGPFLESLALYSVPVQTFSVKSLKEEKGDTSR